MKLAASFGHGVRPSEIVQAAVQCENSGYDAIFISESTGIDALTTLGAVATKTKRIGLATGIVNIYSRSPVQLAMAASTLDELSQSRFTLGIGVSSKGVIANWHGLQFKDQIQKASNSIEVLRSKIGEAPRPSQLSFRPSKSKIPILLAAVGDKMLTLAKQKADGVLFFLRPVSRLKKDAQLLSSNEFTTCASVVTCISEQTGVAERNARRTIAFYITFGRAYRKFLETQIESPVSNEITSSIRNEWLKGRREEAGKIIPSELVDELAVYGTPQECRKKIEHDYLPLSGLSVLGLQFNPGGKDIPDSIRLLTQLPLSK